MQPRNGNRDAAGHNNRRSVFLESKLKEFEIEMERLSSRIEHLKSQNEVLNLTLSESKNHCDNITVLIGKLETLLLDMDMYVAMLVLGFNASFNY